MELRPSHTKRGPGRRHLQGKPEAPEAETKEAKRRNKIAANPYPRNVERAHKRAVGARQFRRLTVRSYSLRWKRDLDSIRSVL